MSGSPYDFLRSLGQQLSALSLYGPRHAGLERGLAEAHEALTRVLGSGGGTFRIHERGIEFDGDAVPEGGAWTWAPKLLAAGIDCIAFEEPPDLASFNARFGQLCVELGFTPPAPVALTARTPAPSGPGAPDSDGGPRSLDPANDLLRQIHRSVERLNTVLWSEVRRTVGLVRSAVDSGAPLTGGSIELADGYSTIHCLNVAILALRFTRHLELGEEAGDLIVEAALLHDIGRLGIPAARPGEESSTPSGRKALAEHPVIGARTLLTGGPEHALCAVVAYEHHFHWQGEGGYPRRHFARQAHRFSRLIRVCDAYDALRTARPFRPAWDREAAMQILRAQASTTFDPELITAFDDLWSRGPLRIPTPVLEPELGAVQLSRLTEGPFDADLEEAPIRL